MPLSPLVRLAAAMLLAPVLWLSAPDARAATVNDLLAGAALEAGGLRIGVASATIPTFNGNRLSYDALSVAADSGPGFVTVDVFAPEPVNIAPADTYVGVFSLTVEALPRDLAIGDVELRFLGGNSALGKSALEIRVAASEELDGPSQTGSIRLPGQDATNRTFINPASFDREPTATLALRSTIMLNAFLSESGNAIFRGYRFTLETVAVPARPPLSPIPSPAALPLLLGALGAMGFVGRRGTARAHRRRG